MKPIASVSTVSNPVVQSSSSRRYSYHKVLDKRKSPIRGLWQRNGIYYARITAADPLTDKKAIRWVRLQVKGKEAEAPHDAQTLADAQQALRLLLVQRDANTLPALQRTPRFADYAAKYLAYHEAVKDAKRPRTIATEKVHLARWTEHLGEIRLDKITLPMIRDFMAKRQVEGWSPRTVNLGIVCLRNVLKRAVEDGWIQRLPTENLKPLKYTPPKRELVTLAQIQRLTEAALAHGKNGQEFVDYVKLMAFCGSRRNETLRIKWADVDWQNQQLTVGADGQSKNGKPRVVDFNDKLEAHLKDMATRRAPDSEWLFPSPQRGDRDIPATTFMETLRLAREHSGLAHFGFHDLRHYFISFGVMSGVDFMTIAKWVGHQDGGILIGKVYGHLASEHTKAQARRIQFEPILVRQAQA